MFSLLEAFFTPYGYAAVFLVLVLASFGLPWFGFGEWALVAPLACRRGLERG